MTSYTDTFTGSPVQTTPTSYLELTISVSTELSWAPYNEDNSNVVANVMEVTASNSSLTLTMPDATEASNGQGTIIRNMGANSFEVLDNGGGSIQVVAAGEVFWIYVTDNSTAAGSWSSFQYGTGTSSADAAALDGYGLAAIGGTLNVAFPVNSYATGFTLNSGYRAQVINWTGGADTIALDAAATLGNNFFFLIRNSGSGTVTIDPNGSETIDGAPTLAIDTDESGIIACNGSAFYSVGKYNAQTITFTRLVKSVAGSSDITLTSGEAGYDIQEYTGTLSGNISVIVPTAVSRWWVYNATSGAYSLTVKTVSGSGIAVTQGTRQILHCDGTDVVKSVDGGAGTLTSIATGTGLTGGPITTSGTISLDTTGVTASSYGGTLGLYTLAVNSYGQLSGVTFSAATITGTANEITVSNGTGSGGAPTISIPAALSFSGKTISGGTYAASSLWNGQVIGVQYGGTGASSLTQSNLIVGAGTNTVTFVAPGSSGNALISNGSSWTSSSLPTGGTVTSVATASGITGGTITSTGTISMNTNNSLGVGAYAILKINNIGGNTNGSTVTTDGSNQLYPSSWTVAGALQASAAALPNGQVWRNVSGMTLGANETGLWIRVS